MVEVVCWSFGMLRGRVEVCCNFLCVVVVIVKFLVLYFIIVKDGFVVGWVFFLV